ncbi:MAG: YkgJ family cysteine cluster protein [Desulfobulbaceae bacterium]|nr:YkgJ family cysteine cluster protein [Desulfobulbaceae bacterium]
MDTYNPCVSCGACCAYYRVSFYWTESDLAAPGGVPHALADHLHTHFLVMKGTDRPTPRCISLKGVIGSQVYCEIYQRRSSGCRNLRPSWENGELNKRCDKARAKWGLPPVDRDAWISPHPDDFPKAA